MIRRKVAKWSYSGLNGAQWILGVLLLLVGAILKITPDQLKQFPSLLSKEVVAVQGAAWIWVIILSIGTGLAGLVKKVVGPPWAWETLHHFLDVFRTEAFASCAEGPEFHHRVTLFKRVQWRWRFCLWPFSGWLVAVERSGHTTQRTSAAFRATDNADSNDGIAGQVWSRRRAVLVADLPSLQGQPTDEDYAAFAERTFVTVEWLKRKRPFARSLLGIPVEVKGEVWGVLVLDSRDPQGVNSATEQKYRPFARYLGKFLERL